MDAYKYIHQKFTGKGALGIVKTPAAVTGCRCVLKDLILLPTPQLKLC